MKDPFYQKTHTVTIIDQTRTRPQETLEFIINKQMETFSFNPPITLIGEEKWLLGMTSFEATNSVFNITNENNSFSITIPGQWDSKSAEKFFDELNNYKSLGLKMLLNYMLNKLEKRNTFSK